MTIHHPHDIYQQPSGGSFYSPFNLRVDRMQRLLLINLQRDPDTVYLGFEPAGCTNRLSWQGTRDVGAAVTFLQAHDETKAIGGLGSSLGGEVLLGAASEYPALKAIAADGTTTRSLDELTALPSERPLYRNFTARVMYAAVQILSGETPPVPLLDSMIAAPSTSYLLIAGGDDMEVAFNELFAAATPDRSQLWIAPAAPHTGAFGLYPDEYEQRVIAFFDRVVLDQK